MFRKILHCCLFSRLQQGLWIFIETFQGYYKDGSDGHRDFRSTSGAHFIIILLITSACISDKIRFGLLPVVQLILVSVSLFYAIARPCKQAHANIIQSLLLGLTAFILLLAYFITVHIEISILLLAILLCLLSPHIMLYSYAVYKVSKKIGRSYQNVRCLTSKSTKDGQVNVEHGCLHWIGPQPDECNALLNDTD